MEDSGSRITFSGIKPTRATSKIIERQIQKWIDREQGLIPLPGQASYTAHIDREDYRFYTCRIEVRIGSLGWSGIEEGRSIHEAVLNTLKVMKPEELIEGRRKHATEIPVFRI